MNVLRLVDSGRFLLTVRSYRLGGSQRDDFGCNKPSSTAKRVPGY